MRKIEITAPSGRGSVIANIAINSGAAEATVSNAHGPKADKDIVSISVSEDRVDSVITKIKTFCERSNIKLDLRLWKVIRPLAEDEENLVPTEELKNDAYQSSTVDIVYLVMITLSAILAALGLLMNSPIVIIGAMIIAPLLKPIMTTSLGTVRGDIFLFLRGLGALIAGISVALIAVFFVCFVIPFVRPTPLIVTLSQLNILMIGVAFVSGIIAAVSMISHLSENLAGVSIAVALMPPIAAVAITGFSWITGVSSFNLFMSSSLVLIINCLAINIGGTITFHLAGMSLKGGTKLLTRELEIAMVLLLIFSIPFFYATYQSYEKSATEEKAKVVANKFAQDVSGIIQSVTINEGNPTHITIVLLSKNPPPEGFEARFKEELEQALGKPVNATLLYLKSE